MRKTRATKKSAPRNEAKTKEIKTKIKSNVTINYKITLSEEQKEAKRLIHDNAVTIILGAAGSGKSQVATITAIDMYFKGLIDKIYITRPMVTTEDLGFLPGGIDEKLSPILRPILDCFNAAADKLKIEEAVEKKDIEIFPIAFMRGMTIRDREVMIADEMQNATFEQVELCLSRLGKGGKLIITGDPAQNDLKNKLDSGLKFAASLNINRYSTITLIQNHRDEMLKEILDAFENERKRREEIKVIRNVQRTYLKD